MLILLVGSLASAQVQWSNLETYDNGWQREPWFGWFTDAGSNWVYHTEHGLIYPRGTASSNLYFYDTSLDSWVWTNEGVYPLIYLFGETSGWYYYYIGGALDARWFYRFEDGLVYQEQAVLDAPVFGSAFTRVSAGTFQMGSPEDQFARGTDEVLHTVTLFWDFFIKKTEVTNTEFAEAMQFARENGLLNVFGGFAQNAVGDSKILFRTSRVTTRLTSSLEPEPGYEFHPVRGISWYGAMFYCHVQSIRESYESPINLDTWTQESLMPGYRLPTEAEWEYSCRAGTPTAFYTGEITRQVSVSFNPEDPALNEAGWYRRNADEVVQPVAQKAPNNFRLYDMHGNVAEWVYDWFDDYPLGPVNDPQGPQSGSSKILRGGDAESLPNGCTSSSRRRRGPGSYQDDYAGFRVVRTVLQ